LPKGSTLTHQPALVCGRSVTPPVTGLVQPPATTAALLQAVADPLRFRILELLAAEELCVCHLQAALDAGQTLVSHHLKTLRAAGLVETEPRGRFTYYRLRPGALDLVRDVLAELATASREGRPKRPC